MHGLTQSHVDYTTHWHHFLIGTHTHTKKNLSTCMHPLTGDIVSFSVVSKRAQKKKTEDGL